MADLDFEQFEQVIKQDRIRKQLEIKPERVDLDNDRKDKKKHKKRSRSKSRKKEKHSSKQESKHEIKQPKDKEKSSKRNKQEKKAKREPHLNDDTDRIQQTNGKKRNKQTMEIEEPQANYPSLENLNDVERQKEQARRKRIDIIKSEIRDLERKIAEFEKEIDEARRQDLTVLMYSLPLKAREKNIYQFFQMYQCGKIRDIRIIRDQKSGRSRGVAYVEFYKDESIPMALALNDRLFVMDGSEVIGQPIKVQMSQAEKNRAARDQKQMQQRQARLQAQTQDLDKITGPARIQITGLMEQMTDFNENELRDTPKAFEPFGEILNVEIPRDEFGRNNGMAYVTFTKAQAAKDAIQTINENFQLNGKRIKVQVVNSGIFDLNMEIDDDFLNNPSMRLSLMQRLMKEDNLESINLPPLMSQLDIKITKVLKAIQSNNPAAGCVSGWKPFSHVVPQCPVATKCVVLGNMWTHEDLQNQGNLIELKEEVENECRKYGEIDMVWVDSKVEGNVLVLFKQEAAAIKVKTIMNMRKFGEKTVLSFYITEQQFFNIIK